MLADTEILEATLVAGARTVVKGPRAGTGAAIWANVNPTHYRGLATRCRAGLGPP